MRCHGKASSARSDHRHSVRGTLFSLAGCCVLGLTTFLGVSASTAWADPCPNVSFRIGPSANLPDCRAYEQVSPADKNGTDIVNVGGNETAPSGDRIAY